MEKALKELSIEVKNALMEAFASNVFKDVVEATKAAEDSGTFEVVISTADIDRSGESVKQDGWNLDLYKMNPVVLWGHDYYSLPIGVCDSVEVVEGKLVAKGRFAPADANPFAQQVRKLYDAKIVRATSVGFIISEMDGNNITKAELLEFSFVPVPANPYALSMRDAQSLGLDISMLAMKGLNDLMKKEEEGGDEKGAVADEVAEVDAWEKKWEKLAPANEIINAFYNVYLHEDTKVEDFDAILAETVSLLSGLTGSTEKTEKIAKAIAEKTVTKHFVRSKAEDELITSIGAVLAGMQSGIDTVMSDSAMKVIEILNAEKTVKADTAPEGTETDTNGGVAQEGGASEAEETPEGEVPNKVDGAGGEEVGKEFDDFHLTRQLLRSVATATTDALERMNVKARERVEEKRRSR